MPLRTPALQAGGLFDLRPARVLWATVLAAALCTVLAGRVFVSFDALRVKLVRTPVAAVEGAVRIETASDARAARLDAPVALVAVIRNPGHVPAEFAIAADGSPVCTARVGPESTHRVDCVVAGEWTRAPSHTLLITGSVDTWSLDFLELATHHGSSSRLVPFFILPDVANALERPSRTAVGLVGILLWCVLLVRAPVVQPVALRGAYWASTAMAVVFLAAVVASPWLSRFQLLLPPGSFVVVSALLLSPRLYRLGVSGARLARDVRWGEWLWRPGVAVAGVAIVVGGLYAMAVRYSVNEFDGNYTGLLRISEAGFDQSPLFAGRDDVRSTLALLPNEGYDGQFMYFAAFDPFLRRFHDDPHQYRDVVDAPPYRFGRIGLPLIVRAVAGDRWHWYPTVMIGLVLLGTAVSAAVIARLAQQSGMSPLWGLTVLAIPGFWQSVRVVLPEPLAAATLLLGYACALQRRVALATTLLAVSLLIRETGVVLVVALAVFLPDSVMAWRQRRWLAAAIVPLVAWRVYVAAGLWADWGWDGLFYGSDNVSAPLAGIAWLWSRVMDGTYHPDVPTLSTAAVWFPLLLGLVSVAIVSLRQRLERHMILALGAYTLMALSFTPKVWSHVGNAQRTSYEAFALLALASVSVSGQTPRQRMLIIGCWLACGALVLFGSYDSVNIRTALFPW